jgi:FG-GAP repeat
VFARTGAVWTQMLKLTARDEVGAGLFGRGVALSAAGDTALVTGYGDADNVGAAWVFVSWPAALAAAGAFAAAGSG